MTLTLRIILFLGFILFSLEISAARPNPKICRSKNGRFPIPGTLCKGYYDCKYYVPEEKTCPDGQHFNANKGLCDWQELYPCLERQKDKGCLKENGQFLKPGTNCKKYYRCCNGRATVQDCPGDSLFDPARATCEWPELYICVESLSTTEKIPSTVTIFATSTPPDEENEKTSTADFISTTSQQTSSLSTTEKTFSTVTDVATFTSPDDLKEKTTIDYFTSTSTVQLSPTTSPFTYFTRDPDFERTTSRIFETSTKISTQPTPTDDRLTSQTSEMSSISQATTSKIATLRPTTVASTASDSRKLSTDSPATSESSISEIATRGISTSTEIPPSYSTTLETSSTHITSTHPPDHTFVKEDKEGDLTISTVPPRTTEVTTPDELNLMCPEPNGYFPHPTDKHKFVGCVDNIPSVLTCPSNLVYKHNLRRCDYE